MSSRSHIPRRLIYTCNCGWIDLGHLQSVESHRNRYASAAYLWKDILHERGIGIPGHSDSHLIQYKQSMGRFGLTQEFAKFYLVKKGLSLSAKRSVALAIFMEVSMGFESLQASMSLLTDSGFSQEDLVSNLIGFYMVVHGALDWKNLCKPVSTEASLAVWDANGPVGSHKTKSSSRSSTPARNARASTMCSCRAFLPRFSPYSPHPRVCISSKHLMGCQCQSTCFRHCFPESSCPAPERRRPHRSSNDSTTRSVSGCAWQVRTKPQATSFLSRAKLRSMRTSPSTTLARQVPQTPEVQE